MALKIFLINIIILLLIISCQEMPNKLPYDNPLDDKNPITQGDPFRLQASIENGKVNLNWSEVQLESVVGYHIYRSIDNLENMSRLASTAKGDTTWIDTSVVNGYSYWYKVTATGKDEEESSQTNVVAVRVDTEPVFLINNDTPFTYSITVTLKILAPGANEMWISNYPDFREGTWETFMASKTWDLLSKDGTRTVYVKFKYDDGSVSSTLRDSIILDLTSPPMVFIPAGEFTMGSDENVGDSDEYPRHTVYVESFWIDKYEVTNKQYANFLSDGNETHYHSRMKIVNDGNGHFVPEMDYEFHPVVYVTYENAVAYARWRGGSLPTEAQWEKAARGNDQRIYPWGNNLESNRANYWNSGDLFEDTPLPNTTPIGYYNGGNWNGYQTKDSPSVLGVYDMAGNVWEWCLDWYQADYYSESPSSNPTGPASGSNRVIRGGSWVDDPYYVRSNCRSYRKPFEAFDHVGFRIVRK